MASTTISSQQLNSDTLPFSASLHCATPPESHMGSASPPPSAFVNPSQVTKSDFSEDMSEYTASRCGDVPHSTPSSHGAEPQKKKRKSWGQVLPKPTTNLPPRKRAKTDEEKAQRKYERVQRNRHAAHMSRMRKQDEMESLRMENDRLRQQLCFFEQEMTRLKDELLGRKVPKTERPPSPPYHFDSDSVPELTSTSPTISSIEAEDSISTPPHVPLFTEATKQTDVSHSAEMCSPQWTSDSPSSPLRVRIKMEDEADTR